MDNLWWIIPVLLFGSGFVGDKISAATKLRHKRKLELIKAEERRQHALATANRPPEPVCGCTHHLAMHGKDDGKCHAVVEAPSLWDADRKPVQYEPQQCNCQQYVGPEPLGTVFAPEITDLR
ncbi:conserved hypothetical protein [Actinacidiphila bryophytorum]|uniref:Uncharacterized protein n=1 Tax=Actinacidiphila bryophytorum TaxID=1436133 RepID=A0A9W4H5T8_9ACTN|nr:conserved hypothetical protein [Actinacidiphila bryophytorum]